MTKSIANFHFYPSTVNKHKDVFLKQNTVSKIYIRHSQKNEYFITTKRLLKYIKLLKAILEF